MARDLREELANLISFPSVSSAPIQPLADHVANRLEDLGMAVRLVPAPGDGKVNVVATAGPQGTDGLLLSGHLDVVPVDGQPWTVDPWRLTERDGRWLGRGTADMKGFVAAVLHALQRTPPDALSRELVVALTCDEEVGCTGADALQAAWRAAGRQVPSAAWIGEPTGFVVHRMHPGHVAVTITVEGVAAHSSRPDLGVNAIDALADVLFALRALAAELRTEADPTLPMSQPFVVLNVAQVQGGSAVNIVPDRAVLELGYRPLPGQEPLAVFRRVRAAVEAAVLGSAVHVHAHEGLVVPPLLTPAGSPLAALLAPYANDGPEAATFATDGGHLAAAGASPLVFGPGDIAVAHKADEWVAPGDLHRAADLVEAAIQRRCTGVGRQS